MFQLASSTASIAVDLEQGGRIASFRVGHDELLVSHEFDPDPLAWGCYPMVPFAGRIRQGKVTFEDETHQLPQTTNDHAMHGYGYLGEWTQINVREIEWHFGEPWPWAGRAVQRFDMVEGRLSIQLTVHAEERQPVSFGWHPWFLRELESGTKLEFDFRPEEMYELDVDQIPTGRVITPPPGPWDNCFVHHGGPPTLRWGDLVVTLRANTDQWVVYDKPEHAVCVEPQTGPPNDVNFAPLVLDAGESTTLEFALEWNRNS